MILENLGDGKASKKNYRTAMGARRFSNYATKLYTDVVIRGGTDLS